MLELSWFAIGVAAGAFLAFCSWALPLVFACGRALWGHFTRDG